MNTSLAALKVFQQARNKGKILTPDDVATGTGLNVHTVYGILARLARSGDLDKVGRGQYMLVPRRPLVSDNDLEPIDIDPSGPNLFAAGEGVAVEADIIEVVVSANNIDAVTLALQMWFASSNYTEGIVSDANLMHVAIDTGYGLRDVQKALEILGAEPVEEGDVSYTRFPRGKLILSVG